MILKQEVRVYVEECDYRECGYRLEAISFGPDESGQWDYYDKKYEEVGRTMVEIELVDFDPVTGILRALESERERLVADKVRAIAVIDEKIAKLTALPAPA